jgi:hypothetical protein
MSDYKKCDRCKKLVASKHVKKVEDYNQFTGTIIRYLCDECISEQNNRSQRGGLFSNWFG